ncbi:MarR family protein [Botrimarina colliarenosi]|uniref:MarR family protein n=1 Tax=Botrimarina colliarenosi TaxID=2528001 RepID=A0A5C6AJW9_9BACT|nr:AsnC family transcriptional regulator [Botrimarina colliarenosi]TWT99706.1 MarR family protein [Botrimarina colliarenosi]
MTPSDETDRLLLDHLRRHATASVGDLGELLGVTATAIRQRLTRLMAEGLIERKLHQSAVSVGGQEGGEAKKPNGRGRPSYDYALTDRGRQAAGDNYHDLAEILWEEIRKIDEPRVRVGLVKRVAERLASRYSSQTDGQDVADRMRHLMRLMGEREVPVDVDESGGLPVLTMLACPYPTLAEQDRSICAVEKAMISEIVGRGVRLSECRLDGGGCCSFEASALPSDSVEIGAVEIGAVEVSAVEVGD